MKKTLLDFGQWPSWIPKKDLFSEKTTRSFLRSDQKNLYWLEKQETGRKTIYQNGIDLLPETMSASTGIYGYGGCPYFVFEEGIVFSNEKEKSLYLLSKKSVTKLPVEKASYADGAQHKELKGFYIVREKKEIERSEIVFINASHEEKVVGSGRDFYSSLTVSPDGKKLVYLTWSLPFMPWQKTVLVERDILPNGDLGKERVLLGEKMPQEIFAPSFSKEGILYFVSNQTGYANIYSIEKGFMKNICPIQVEMSLPSWVVGLKTYAIGEKEIYVTYLEKGESKLGKICLKKSSLTPISLDVNSYLDLSLVGDRLYFLAGFKKRAPGIFLLDETSFQEVYTKSVKKYGQNEISFGERFSFSTKDRIISHGIFYAPKHPLHEGLKKPPAIFKVHSGPTSLHQNDFSYETQFWTSRGFAYIAVNYHGSTGYGVSYRDALNGQWGRCDVNDLVFARKHLIDQGKIDSKKTVIRGSSSGGYTALMASVFGVFQAVISYYGITDLEALSKTTHKFERGYNETLIGPWPEKKALYQVLSPIHFPERISGAVLLFHGEMDLVVPVQQAKDFYQKLQNLQKKVVLKLFPSEGHGFQKDTKIEALYEEYAFLKAHLLAKESNA